MAYYPKFSVAITDISGSTQKFRLMEDLFFHFNHPESEHIAFRTVLNKASNANPLQATEPATRPFEHEGQTYLMHRIPFDDALPVLYRAQARFPSENITSAFEPTRSFCYNFARHQVLPRILTLPKVLSGEPFRMIDLAKPIIDEYLTHEQQTMAVPMRDKESTVGQSIKHFTRQVAIHKGRALDLLSLKDGMFQLQTAPEITDEQLQEMEDDEIKDAVADGDDQSPEVDYEGIYAFSYPGYVKDSHVYPIKVGMTAGDVKNASQLNARDLDFPKRP
jgi:hypothetical protein